MAEVALASDCAPIVVVLGANRDCIKLEISDLPLHIVENDQWSEGMGSSIRAGVKQIAQINQQLDAVVVMLCDQPLVTASRLNQLIEAYQINRSQVIASAYTNTLGVPALFSRARFPELLSLTANVGAKYLIQHYRDQVYAVPFPEGAIDLDTPDDYQQWCF
jgi:molybdenum cofactor cytidylyltransferase